MREQLTKYVELLFAGRPNDRDMQQEILQNTLDRYDDLIAQGKSPEAAYSLSISGIGDINEVLGSEPAGSGRASGTQTVTDPHEAAIKKQRKAAAIAFYILCPVPMFILSEFGLETMGLCFMLLLVAAATALLVLNGKEQKDVFSGTPVSREEPEPTRDPVIRTRIRTLIWFVGLIVYFAMSIITGAWYITWILLPLIGCIQGLIIAIMDLKEAG